MGCRTPHHSGLMQLAWGGSFDEAKVPAQCGSSKYRRTPTLDAEYSVTSRNRLRRRHEHHVAIRGHSAI
jgi:hypothetical protein